MRYIRLFTVFIIILSVPHSDLHAARVPSKLKKEILADLARQSEAIAGYSNDIAGFKINFKRKRNVDLSTRRPNLESPTGRKIRARYHFYRGDSARAYMLFDWLPPGARNTGDELMMIESLYRLGLFTRAERALKELRPQKLAQRLKASKLKVLIASETGGSKFRREFLDYLEVSKRREGDFLYSLGKQLFFRGFRKEADQVFASIKGNQINYFRGGYFRVAHLVMQNRISAAITELRKLESGLKKINQEGKLVVRQLKDHINLAMGRAYYEIGRYGAAIDRFNRIDRKSSKFREALIEIAWCFHRMGKSSLARSMVDGIDAVEGQGRLQLDVTLLRANMFASEGEHEKALKAYDSVEDLYMRVRNVVESRVETNRNVFSMTELFIKMAEREKFDSSVKPLREWVEVHELAGLRRYTCLHGKVQGLREEISETSRMMKTIREASFEKRDQATGPASEKKQIEDFVELGRRLYEIIQDVRERERYLLCLDISAGECSDLREVAARRYEYFKKFVVDSKGHGEKLFQVFRELQKYLNEEEVVLKRIRARYNISSDILALIDSLKASYTDLNVEYLEIHNWIRVQLMENYGGFHQKRSELKNLEKEIADFSVAMEDVGYKEVTGVYEGIQRRLNRYRYNVMVGKNEIVWKLKNAHTEKFISTEEAKKNRIKSLQNSFREVFSEKD